MTYVCVIENHCANWIEHWNPVIDTDHCGIGRRKAIVIESAEGKPRFYI
jgi:hypothetical protein